MCVLKAWVEHHDFFACAATEVLLIKILKLPDIMEERLVHDERGLYMNTEVTNTARDIDSFPPVLSWLLSLPREQNQNYWMHKLLDRKSTRLNSSHGYISYAVFC